MKNLETRDIKGRVVDGIIPEVDDDRLYYWVVIDREEVYYASNRKEAEQVLEELVEAREEGNLEERLAELKN